MKKISHIGLFLLFLICGISLPALSGLFVFPFSLIPPSMDLTYRISLSIIFLFSTIFSLKSKRVRKYWEVLFSFFIASFAINLQAVSAFIHFQTSPINSIALAMLTSTILVIMPIIVLTSISGGSLSSIFIKKGNIRLGLIIGLAGFSVFAAVSIPLATSMFQGQNISLDRVIAWAPWIFVTVIANGIREELLYRGLFLKKYEPLLGSNSSNLLQAIIFSLSHSVAGRGTITYTPFTTVLILETFLLGLAWGYVMRKTDNLLGSILFHAGSDISVFIGIFSNIS